MVLGIMQHSETIFILSTIGDIACMETSFISATVFASRGACQMLVGDRKRKRKILVGDKLISDFKKKTQATSDLTFRRLNAALDCLLDTIESASLLVIIITRLENPKATSKI